MFQIPTALLLSDAQRELTYRITLANEANRRFDATAGRIRQQRGMRLRMEQVIAIGRFTHA